MTLACAAGTVTEAIAIAAGKPMTRQSATSPSRTRCTRGRGGRRAAKIARATTPPIAARATVTNHGSRYATAARVAGSDPPNMTTARRPRARPRVRLDKIMGLERTGGG